MEGAGAEKPPPNRSQIDLLDNANYFDSAASNHQTNASLFFCAGESFLAKRAFGRNLPRQAATPHFCNKGLL